MGFDRDLFLRVRDRLSAIDRMGPAPSHRVATPSGSRPRTSADDVSDMLRILAERDEHPLDGAWVELARWGLVMGDGPLPGIDIDRGRVLTIMTPKYHSMVLDLTHRTADFAVFGASGHMGETALAEALPEGWKRPWVSLGERCDHWPDPLEKTALFGDDRDIPDAPRDTGGIGLDMELS